MDFLVLNDQKNRGPREFIRLYVTRKHQRDVVELNCVIVMMAAYTFYPVTSRVCPKICHVFYNGHGKFCSTVAPFLVANERLDVPEDSSRFVQGQRPR